ncbi:MAG: hypothetical protein M3P26_10495 [Gemmatimonadota bacterium]|nr:hypothetical protein [Gemmatimonadota bacterium]
MSDKVEETATPGTAVVAAPKATLMRPIAKPADILVAQEETRALIQETLKEGRDYGLIPGIKKPSLLKPGAERVGIAFGCYPRYRIVEKEVDHDRKVEWRKKKRVYNNAHKNDRTYKEEEVTGESLGLYRYVVECELVHRDTDAVIGSCIGVCSTMESKYVDRPRESENTALKIAQKRAHVGAVLNAFGLSEQFTQDVEDNPEAAAVVEQPPKKTDFTLEEAKAFPFPFKRGTPINGKPLAELASSHLTSIRDWIRLKQEEDEDFHQDTIAAINVVLADREKDQTKLDLHATVTDTDLEEDLRERYPTVASASVPDDDLPF